MSRLSSPRFRRRLLRWGSVAAAVGHRRLRRHPLGEHRRQAPEGLGRAGADGAADAEDRAAPPAATNQVRGDRGALHPDRRLPPAPRRGLGAGRAGAARGDDARGSGAPANIPVVPFPASDVAEIRWRLDYSFPRLIGMKIALVTKPHAKHTGMVASMEMQAVGPGAHRRWLVDAWVPLGGGEDLRRAIEPVGANQTVHTSRALELDLAPAPDRAHRRHDPAPAGRARRARLAPAGPRPARLQLELETVVGLLEPVLERAARAGGASAAAASRPTPRTRRRPRSPPGARASRPPGSAPGASPRRGRGRRRGRASAARRSARSRRSRRARCRSPRRGTRRRAVW